jgi:uncharacterized membrane protein
MHEEQAENKAQTTDRDQAKTELATGKKGSWLTTDRITALADGIFAFAMTLLVITIDLPEAAKSLSGDQLHSYILAQWHPLLIFAQSFVLLAVFWTIHHRQFQSIQRTNHRHLWINLFLLLFIVLFPYTTDLLGDFSGDWMVELIFALNMLALGLLFSINWAYATRGHRLVDPSLSQEAIVNGTRRGWVIPFCSLLACGLSLAAPHYASYAYILIPIILLQKPFRI